jgi:hypothetical protein
MPITIVDGTSSEEAKASRVRIIHPQFLPHVWPMVLKVLREHPRELLDGYYTEADIYEKILLGGLDLWIGLDSLDEGSIDFVSLCRLEKYTGFSLYRIEWVGGKFLDEHLIDATDQVSRYARDIVKADKLAFSGGLGWTRIMEKFNFSVVRFEMWKPLSRSN